MARAVVDVKVVRMRINVVRINVVRVGGYPSQALWVYGQG